MKLFTIAALASLSQAAHINSFEQDNTEFFKFDTVNNSDMLSRKPTTASTKKLATLTAGDSVEVGKSLGPGESIESAGKKCKFDVMPDGNMIVTDLADGGQIIWHSGYTTQAGAKLDVTEKGLELKKDSVAWQVGGENVGKLIIQDDCNLVLYTKDNKAIWATYADGFFKGECVKKKPAAA